MDRSGEDVAPSGSPGAARGRPGGAGAARTATWLLLAAVTAGISGCGAEVPRGDAAAGDDARFRGTLLRDPVETIDFTLTDTRGRPFDFRTETAGEVTLLFFGYTHCPDVCPVQLSNLAAALAGLRYQDRRRVRVVFVTVDPARDSAERVRRWLDRFDPRFTGLRGPKARVDSIQRALGLAPSVADGRDTGEPRPGEGYTVGHGSQVLAFTPDGNAHLAYPFGTRQRDWAHDLPLLLERARGAWGAGD